MGIFSTEIRNTYSCLYVQGLPNVSIGNVCRLSFDDNFLIIKSVKGKGIFRKKVEVINTFKINHNKIISFDIVNKSNIETKSKSVVGRGIAGGLIFGPVGAIIGGMSGTKQDIKSTDEYFLNIAYYGENNNELKTIIFKVGVYCDLARIFIQEYNNKFMIENLNINKNGEIIL